MNTDPRGVLVMAHGTPANLDDLAAFYTDIRRGRPPTEELLQDLRRRYVAIGGTSPLAQITDRQVAALRNALDGPVRVELGYRFAEPRIEEAVGALASAGVRRAVGIVLAPHSSVVSVREYARRAEHASPDTMAVSVIDRWHRYPGLARLWAGRLREAMSSLHDAPVERTRVIFSAHSVPQRVVDEGDDYPQQVRETAEAVASESGLVDFDVAWQSAGRTPEPWLGPELLDAIRASAERGARAVVVCPVGFVSDHLEVLYDVDIEARSVAQGAGLEFARPRSPNDDPAFIDVIARAVTDAWAGAECLDA